MNDKDVLIYGLGLAAAYYVYKKTVGDTLNIIPSAVTDLLSSVNVSIDTTSQNVANSLQQAYIQAINGFDTTNGFYPSWQDAFMGKLFETGIISATDYEKYVNSTVGYVIPSDNIVTSTYAWGDTLTLDYLGAHYAEAPFYLPLGVSLTWFADTTKPYYQSLYDTLINSGFQGWSANAINDYAYALRNSFL